MCGIGTRHVLGETNTYKFLAGVFEGKILFWELGLGWVDNMRIYLKEI
jgi:hypothetical protein